MIIDELIRLADQQTLLVALVSLMGTSVSIAFAMAVAIHYLDKPIASLRQIVVTTAVVLTGFYAVVSWPDPEPITSPDMTAPSIAAFTKKWPDSMNPTIVGSTQRN